MNSLLNDERDDDVEDSHPRYGKDREITLGTTVILGIFFALSVFGAVMFGFGYSVGAKHTMASAAGPVGPGSSATFNTFKPAPGSPLSGSSTAPGGKSGATVTVPYDPAQTGQTAPTPLPKPAPVTKASSADFDQNAAASAQPAPARTSLPPAVLSRPTPPPAALPSAPVSAAVPPVAGQFMVQIAAVSHQEDADLLVSTLKRRNYAVAVHHEPQDSLLHVQIGPFSNKKDADAMRQRLLADGYNAITK